MEKEKIKLSVDDLEMIRNDEHELYEVVKHEVTGTWRHGTEESAVVKRVSDGKYFAVDYRDSVKESCEFSDMNFGGEYTEVFQKEKVTVVYE